VVDLDHLKHGPEDSTAISLLELLGSFCGRRTLKPRDKIFALLGLADKVEDLVEKIDYTEPCYLTYARAAHFVINQNAEQTNSPNLGIFS
jgi:hypothetical protein